MFVRCLQCLDWFDWADFVWRNDDGETRRQLRNKPTSLLLRVLDRIRGVAWAEEAQRAELLAGGYRLACPAGHWVPEDLDKQTTYVIGLVGPTGSSKSTYIASAVQLMREGALAPLHLTAHLHSWSNQLFETDYYAKLWLNKTVVPRTNRFKDEESRRPLSLELRHAWSGRKWNLVFYDTAGEDLVDASRQAWGARYLANSYGFIFFVDPASISAFRANGSLSTGHVSGDSSDIIYRTAEMLRRVRGLPESHCFDDVPVAIAIAKSDLFDDRSDLPQWQSLSTKTFPKTLTSDSLQQVRGTSDLIAEMLESVGETNLILTVANAFSNHTYHLLSAAGSDPGASETFPLVEPRNCLNPIAALLWSGTEQV